MRDEVNRLIAAERRHMPSKDYLKDLAIPNVSFSSPLLQSEWERVSRGRALPALDTSRYMLETPTGSAKNDVEAWTAAVNNAAAQLQQQSLRLMNLELLLKYGANACRIQNFELEAFIKQLESIAASLKDQITQLSVERKTEQVRAIEKIQLLEQRLAELTYRSIEVQLACDQLEAQTK